MKKIPLVIALCFHHITFIKAATILTTTEIVFNNFAAQLLTTCNSLGADYFDSSKFSCELCGKHQAPLKSKIDGAGNYMECQCATGFYRVDNDCSQV
jgi:hypothetical protein